MIKISFASPQSEIQKRQCDGHQASLPTKYMEGCDSHVLLWMIPFLFHLLLFAIYVTTSTTNWAEVLLQQILEKEKLRSPLSDEDFLLNSFFPRYPQDIRIVRSTKR